MLPEQTEQMVLPLPVHQVIRNKIDSLPGSLRREATGGNQNMQMGIELPRTAEGLQHHRATDVERRPGCGLEDVFEAGVTGPHQLAEQFGILIKPMADKVGGREDEVSISDTRKEASSDEIGPLAHPRLSTGKAETRLAGKADPSGLAAAETAILYVAHSLRVAAVEHPLDDGAIVGPIEARIPDLEGVPMISENLLESVFVDRWRVYPLGGSRRCKRKVALPERVRIVLDDPLRSTRIDDAFHKLSSGRTAYQDSTTREASTCGLTQKRVSKSPAKPG